MAKFSARGCHVVARFENTAWLTRPTAFDAGEEYIVRRTIRSDGVILEQNERRGDGNRWSTPRVVGNTRAFESLEQTVHSYRTAGWKEVLR